MVIIKYVKYVAHQFIIVLINKVGGVGITRTHVQLYSIYLGYLLYYCHSLVWFLLFFTLLSLKII